MPTARYAMVEDPPSAIAHSPKARGGEAQATPESGSTTGCKALKKEGL
ncbi:MAG: hypothetical protein KME08_03095 [Aphanothece sp. CMT-3BRIN-NPC111]|jgi:hypothetical protein|nr:hypothetical protein [Aphanothece sp. CMT-3BRIN-NPC111]